MANQLLGVFRSQQSPKWAPVLASALKDPLQQHQFILLNTSDMPLILVRSQMPFIDFKKAFDMVNHQPLLNKLSFNLDLSAINMLSYLSGRNKSVCFGKSKSPQTPCSIGVPQGSILGPLLFILHINDLPSVCQSTQVIMYADDTVVFEFWSWPNLCQQQIIIWPHLS